MADDFIPGDPRCPACGSKLDGFTDVSLEDARPSPGDGSICAYCAAMLTFDRSEKGRLILRYPTDKELAVFTVDPKMILARDAVMEMIRVIGSTYDQ